MTVSLLGLGTAWPPHRMTQQEATQLFSDIVCEDERQRRLAKMLFRKAEVETRYTVVPHKVAYNWCQDVSGIDQPSQPIDRAVASQLTPQVIPGQSHGPSTQERMELFARFASDLAIQSSEQALVQAGVLAQQITHLVVVTCTGFDAPGVDIELIERLGLPRTTQRVQVGFMGCHAAVNGLRTGLAIATADPRVRVLMCAVELCSLHYRYTWDSEGIIGNALFADGSAAVVLGQTANRLPSTSDNSEASAFHWQLHDTGSVVIPDSQQAMSWSIGNHGFDMRLTSDVGEKIEAELEPWLSDWLRAHELSVADIDFWGVHPGGPRILDAVQNSLQLPPAAMGISRSILQRHGNMSSPTVLFILNEFRKQRDASSNTQRQHCILLGFGPGLVAEIALLSIG